MSYAGSAAQWTRGAVAPEMVPSADVELGELRSGRAVPPSTPKSADLRMNGPTSSDDAAIAQTQEQPTTQEKQQEHEEEDEDEEIAEDAENAERAVKGGEIALRRRDDAVKRKGFRPLTHLASHFQQRLVPGKGLEKTTGYRSNEFDTAENAVAVEYAEEETMSQFSVTPLRMLKEMLINEEMERTKAKQKRWTRHLWRNLVVTCHNIFAAFYIYLVHTVSIEGVFVVLNSIAVTSFYLSFSSSLACKLDFSILSFAVVFPLTFLIQQAFSRRETALMRLADFRALLLQCVLAALSWDWASEGEFCGGRSNLPSNFNRRVHNDARDMVELVYEYLSMPTVSHARHRIIPSERRQTRNIHAQQNDIMKRVNMCFVQFNDHTEVMKAKGFPSGEASRLSQYHLLLQERLEALRMLKYYRTPQATRSFGRVYVFILPWLFGPYFSWVHTQTGWAFALVLAVFSFLILLGLLNTQKYLEDPFVEFDNGVDFLKLQYEMASTLQTLEMYFEHAEKRRISLISPTIDEADLADIQPYRTLTSTSNSASNPDLANNHPVEPTTPLQAPG